MTEPTETEIDDAIKQLEPFISDAERLRLPRFNPSRSGAPKLDVNRVMRQVVEDLDRLKGKR